MDIKHHCNGCPHWYVTQKKYPSGFYNITICGKYNKQLYYMAGEENQTPHPCNICAEQFSYIPYIEQILDGVEQVTERLSANCPCNKCGKDKKCVLAKEACEDFLKWEDNCIKKDEKAAKKIDVFWQLKNNWYRFIEYLWYFSCNKHGHWVFLDECANEGIYCSVCNKKVYKKEYANQKIKSKYCPNCGAIMDENFEVL